MNVGINCEKIPGDILDLIDATDFEALKMGFIVKLMHTDNQEEFVKLCGAGVVLFSKKIEFGEINNLLNKQDGEGDNLQ